MRRIANAPRGTTVVRPALVRAAGIVQIRSTKSSSATRIIVQNLGARDFLGQIVNLLGGFLDDPVWAAIPEAADDPQVSARLWAALEQLGGVRFGQMG